MSKSFTIIESFDVNRLLKIAKRHLDYIKKSKSSSIKLTGPKPNHVIVASIFSAAAVEAGLNIFISMHVLFIKDDYLKNFLGHLSLTILGFLFRTK